MGVSTLLRSMYRLNKNPGDREGQLGFVLSLDHAALERRRRFLRASDAGRRLLSERPELDARHVTRAQLLALPAGTFGHALGRFLEQWHIEPFDAPSSRCADELEWIAQRTADTHDCVHVATGYGADPLGEIEVQAFMWAQWQPLTVLVVSFFGFFMSALKAGPVETWRRYRAALARGRAVRPLDDIIWEEQLGRPLDEVRAELGLAAR